MIFAIVFILTNGCKKDGSSDDGNTPSTPLTITSLSKYSAMPASQILITGSGFDTGNQLVARFSNNNEYQIDVPVFQANGNQLIVSIPPFINTTTKEFEAGTVSVTVVVKNNMGENVSNKIESFEILDMPFPIAKDGRVTLLFLNSQIMYYQQLLQDIVGTELENQEMYNTISNNQNNLSELYVKIKGLVESPGSLTTFFTMGSINGQEIKIGKKEIAQCDRFILAMFAALKNNDVLSPLNTGISYDKSTNGAPCVSRAEAAYNDLLNGTDYSSTYNYYDCLITAQPQAVATASNVVFGAGSVGLGIVAIGALSIGVPASVAIALPAAAITYATVMTGGLQISMGASLKNINDEAALKLLNAGVKQINDMLVDMAVGTMLSDFTGAVKDLCSGIYSLNEAFSSSYTEPGCTFVLSSTSVQITSTGGSGTVSVTTGTGCTWTATSGYNWISITSGNNGNGNGTIGYTIQANTESQQRIGAIQIEDKSFSVSQEAIVQTGQYDGNWTFTMVGTFSNPNIDPPTWPWPETSAEMSIAGHNLIGWGEYGFGVLGNDGYAAWSIPEGYLSYSGTFYIIGTGIGTWNYGPDGAGTTAAGTWSATRH